MDELHRKYFYLLKYFTIHCKLLLMWNERYIGTISYYSFYPDVFHAIWRILSQKRIQPQIIIIYRRNYWNRRHISIKFSKEKPISTFCDFIRRMLGMFQWTYLHPSNTYLLVILSWKRGVHFWYYHR